MTKIVLNTVTTVLVAALGVHALLKFVFFALPYRRRRAALDKSYGDRPSATTTSDTVVLLFTIARAGLMLWRGVEAVSISTSSMCRCPKIVRHRRSFRRSSRCPTPSRIRLGDRGASC